MTLAWLLATRMAIFGILLVPQVASMLLWWRYRRKDPKTHLLISIAPLIVFVLVVAGYSMAVNGFSFAAIFGVCSAAIMSGVLVLLPWLEDGFVEVGSLALRVKMYWWSKEIAYSDIDAVEGHRFALSVLSRESTRTTVVVKLRTRMLTHGLIWSRNIYLNVPDEDVPRFIEEISLRKLAASDNDA